MDPHLLRTFTVVARQGSFSAAARELGYTQSAVSQQIAALEADLGVPLLHRRPVAATEAGVRLLEHAEPLLLRLAAARADLARLTAAPADRLRLGATPPALTAPVAAALARLRAERPRLEPVVTVRSAEQLLAALATGELDLVLVDGAAAPSDPLPLPGGPDGLTAVGVAEETATVALPDGHPLAGRRGLDLADLADAHWIDASAAAVPLARLRALAGGAFRAVLRYDGTDVRGLLALVAAGHGLAVLPHSAVRDCAGVPLRAPRLVHRTEAVHPAGPSPAVRAAVAALRGS